MDEETSKEILDGIAELLITKLKLKEQPMILLNFITDEKQSTIRTLANISKDDFVAVISELHAQHSPQS